ncbi:MAG: substrate-binding domain-containing protein [Pirellulales bacterium]|nr:substrate-binding domain-containing protein [Pirellulales bacterium]
MSTMETKTSGVQRLAERLRDDIGLRGLNAGEPYLTAAEAAEMFGVSTAMAHRALKVLADDKWVLRRRNAGTFVGSSAGQKTPTRVQTVHVLMPADIHITLVRTDLLLNGIRGALENVQVQFGFLPEAQSVEYVEGLLRAASAGGEVVGVVAIRCRNEVYRYLAETGLPVVVVGTLWAGGLPLPSIDTDQHETGRLLTQYLIDRGHKRMALLTGANGWPGDNDFLDGVSEALTTARLPHNAMITRITPHDAETFKAAARQLLEMHDRAGGLIVRGQALAEMAAKVAGDMGFSVPGDVEIVFQDFGTRQVERSAFPHVQTRMHFEEVAARIGRMLDDMRQGNNLEKERVVIPVELHKPSLDNHPPKQAGARHSRPIG